jgi:hypothetical protein
MRVRATALGYYGHKRRREGQEFVLEPIKRLRKQKDGSMREIVISAEQQFSNKWMERLDQPAAPVEKKDPETAPAAGL